MVGLLDGGLASVFAGAFAGIFSDGALHSNATGPQYDDAGDITGYTGGGDVAIKVQRDAATWAMRQAEGFAEGDVALIVLAEGLPGPITTEHRITDGAGAKWTVESVSLDAASSHWLCRGRRAD